MRVNETFLSLQGEGYFTGTPAFFLRFSGCNLKCSFCDTNHQPFKEMGEDEIVEEASRHKPRHIVITGGEPALQFTTSLVEKLHEAGFFIQVETNGTLPLPEGIDWVTVSPKTEILSSLKGKIDELKVLYTGDFQPSVSHILRESDGQRLPKLYLQPLDTGNEIQNRIILRDTMAYIMEHPEWSLSLQTHKLLGIK